MYLKDLMQGEKYAFYSIVKYLVTIDGEFAKEEMNLMDEFLQEMQLEKEYLDRIANDFLIGDELRDKLFETVNELLEIYKRMRILTETP